MEDGGGKTQNTKSVVYTDKYGMSGTGCFYKVKDACPRKQYGDKYDKQKKINSPKTA